MTAPEAPLQLSLAQAFLAASLFLHLPVQEETPPQDGRPQDQEAQPGQAP